MSVKLHSVISPSSVPGQGSLWYENAGLVAGKPHFPLLGRVLVPVILSEEIHVRSIGGCIPR